MAEYQSNELMMALLRFAHNTPNNYWHCEIPLEAEREIALVASASSLLSEQQSAEIRSTLTIRSAAALNAFSMRLASWAVRSTDKKLLDLSMLVLVLDDDPISDWRDILTILSWIDFCAKSLGVRLEDIVEKVIDLSATRRRATIESYLSEEPAMRDPLVMGIAPVGTGPTFHLQYLS